MNWQNEKWEMTRNIQISVRKRIDVSWNLRWREIGSRFVRESAVECRARYQNTIRGTSKVKWKTIRVQSWRKSAFEYRPVCQAGSIKIPNQIGSRHSFITLKGRELNTVKRSSLQTVWRCLSFQRSDVRACFAFFTLSSTYFAPVDILAPSIPIKVPW